MYEDTKAYH